jgi:hypothetical protein
LIYPSNLENIKLTANFLKRVILIQPPSLSIPTVSRLSGAKISTKILQKIMF